MDDHPGNPEPHDPRVMSFGQHLDELRSRLVWTLILLAPIFAATLYWGGDLLNFILEPARQQMRAAKLPEGMMATAPLETLGAYLKVAGVVTIVAGIPILLMQVWLFVRPGLYPHERRYAGLLVPFSILLSLLGLAFLYYVMLPAMLHFLLVFGADIGRPPITTIPRPPGVTVPQIPILPDDPVDSARGEMWINEKRQELRVDVTPPPTATDPAPARLVVGTPVTRSSGIQQQYKISEYVNLVFTMSLAFVVGFQTPVVVLLLGWVGIVDHATMARSRKYAVFGAFIIAAILTPSPDPFNMSLLALPLYILYELGLLLLKVFPAGRVQERRAEAAAAARGRSGREGPDAGDE